MNKDTPVYVSQPSKASDCVITDSRIDTEGDNKTLVFVVEDLSI